MPTRARPASTTTLRRAGAGTARGNVLITGFEPFGGMADNPSGRVATALDGRMIGGCKVVARILPVSLSRLDAAIDTALVAAGPKPSLVIGLGVLAGFGFLKLERVAANKLDFRHDGPDNDGRQPTSGTIEPGPASRRSTFDVEKALTALGTKRIPAQASDSAGFFICNATLFKLLARADTNACGFVHMPEASEAATTRRSLPFATLVDGIATICEALLTQAPPRPRRRWPFGAAAATKPAAARKRTKRSTKKPARPKRAKRG